MREGNAERGFTLVELMVVVGIIAVLVAVVVPTFIGESRKTKGRAEINAMLAELRLKEDNYRSEMNVYLDAAECPSTGPNPAGYNALSTCKTGSTPWDTLRIQPSETTLRCSYQVEAGLASDTIVPPTGFTVPATTVATSWYWVLAKCDENGQGGTNAQYFTSSLDPVIQARNEGQ